MVANLEIERIPVLPGNELPVEYLPVLYRCPTCDEVSSGAKMKSYALAWELVNDADYPAVDYSVPCRKHEAA